MGEEIIEIFISNRGNYPSGWTQQKVKQTLSAYPTLFNMKAFPKIMQNVKWIVNKIGPKMIRVNTQNLFFLIKNTNC